MSTKPAQSAESQFHRSRRMFCVRGGKLLIAPPNSPKSHKEWLKDPHWDEYLRGFVDERGVFFYKGQTFRASRGIAGEILAVLPALQRRLRLHAELVVFAGMVAGAVGQRWLPRKTVGKIGDLLSGAHPTRL